MFYTCKMNGWSKVFTGVQLKCAGAMQGVHQHNQHNLRNKCLNLAHEGLVNLKGVQELNWFPQGFTTLTTPKGFIDTDANVNDDLALMIMCYIKHNFWWYKVYSNFFNQRVPYPTFYSQKMNHPLLLSLTKAFYLSSESSKHLHYYLCCCIHFDYHCYFIISIIIIVINHGFLLDLLLFTNNSEGKQCKNEYPWTCL